jgi:hypothetical protein
LQPTLGCVRKNNHLWSKRMTTKCSYLWSCSVLALGLAAPALAGGTYPTTLNDSQEPGSVLVFYRFAKGNFPTTGAKSQFTISVTCPSELAATTGCAETGDFNTGQKVNLVAHWVCPPADPTTGSTCAEQDFPLSTTVFGTVEFYANGVGAPTPPCDTGYLIVWVVNDVGQRISFNGLIGTAVIQGSETSARAYNALPIQSTACTGTTLSADALHFDGTDYQAVTGGIYGGVTYPNTEETKLVLLTLDVLSAQPNLATSVPLKFYNESEYYLSTSATFTCWGEFSLTRDFGGALNNYPFSGREGLVRSTGGAVQGGNAATLVGVVETSEFLTNNTTGQVLETLQSTPLVAGTTVSLPCSDTGSTGVNVSNCSATCDVATGTLCFSLTNFNYYINPGTSCGSDIPVFSGIPTGLSSCSLVTNLLTPINVTREYTYPLLNDSIPVPTTFVPSISASTPP